jgi:hypothetical protein
VEAQRFFQHYTSSHTQVLLVTPHVAHSLNHSLVVCNIPANCRSSFQTCSTSETTCLQHNTTTHTMRTCTAHTLFALSHPRHGKSTAAQRTWMVPSSMPAARSLPSLLYAHVVTPTRDAEGVVGRTTVFCRMWLVSQILQADQHQQRHLRLLRFVVRAPYRTKASKQASKPASSGEQGSPTRRSNQQCSAIPTSQCRPLSSSQP